MKNINIDLTALMQAANCVKTKWPKAKPFASLVLGSGWGDVAKAFDIKDELPYEKITGLGKGSVEGHASKLSLAEINGKEFFIFQGRRHWYEGEGWTPVVIPGYISKHFDASILLLTNAAGGISYPPGSLMTITDHINNMFSNPLVGPHREELGDRFPDQSEVYSKELRKIIKKTSKKIGAKMHRGIFIAISGPTYETPAEIQTFKKWGANATGMSTAPEAAFANSIGLKVAAISCITNHAAGLTKNPLTHVEVIETMNSIMPKMVKLIPKIMENFAKVKS